MELARADPDEAMSNGDNYNYTFLAMNVPNSSSQVLPRIKIGGVFWIQTHTAVQIGVVFNKVNQAYNRIYYVRLVGSRSG